MLVWSNHICVSLFHPQSLHTYPEETIQVLAYVVVFLAGIHDGKVTYFLLIRGAINLLKGADLTATEEQVEENSYAGAGGESTSEMPNEVQVEEDMNIDENEVLEATGESPVEPPAPTDSEELEATPPTNTKASFEGDEKEADAVALPSETLNVAPAADSSTANNDDKGSEEETWPPQQHLEEASVFNLDDDATADDQLPSHQKVPLCSTRNRASTSLTTNEHPVVKDGRVAKKRKSSQVDSVESNTWLCTPRNNNRKKRASSKVAAVSPLNEEQNPTGSPTEVEPTTLEKPAADDEPAVADCPSPANNNENDDGGPDPSTSPTQDEATFEKPAATDPTEAADVSDEVAASESVSEEPEETTTTPPEEDMTLEDPDDPTPTKEPEETATPPEEDLTPVDPTTIEVPAKRSPKARILTLSESHEIRAIRKKIEEGEDVDHETIQYWEDRGIDLNPKMNANQRRGSKMRLNHQAKRDEKFERATRGEGGLSLWLDRQRKQFSDPK